MYINNQVNYKRRKDLEKIKGHLIIIDIKLEIELRVITIYRSFRPPDNLSQSAFFTKQLNIVKDSNVPNMVVLGDFNLDAEMQYRIDYPHRHLFDELNLVTTQFNLYQLVDFPTWSRRINNLLKQSTLDHVYVSNYASVLDCNSFHPPFGDHIPVVVEINHSKPVIKTSTRRDWHFYTALNCSTVFESVNFDIDCNDVQEYWNNLENIIINEVDKLVPLTEFKNDCGPISKPPQAIRNKLNKRKRLIKKYKAQPSPIVHSQVKLLDKDIKYFYYKSKAQFIQSKIIPGNSHSLWTAVKIAKNESNNAIPKNLTRNGQTVIECEAANVFAGYFYDKVGEIKSNTMINNYVYNGMNKLLVVDRFFMTENDIIECIDSLKPKNCEGFDRIPVRILYDARKSLLPSLIILFQKIYDQQSIPEQWKVAKVIPIFKKGSKTKIENYRPIANQCSTSKIFEKLILKQINYLETVNKLDFTGKQQHGFKKTKSTATAGLLLQSLISHSTDSGNYALMASLDLSAAFDIVNVNLLLKRLRIIGLPMDLIKIIEVWLTDRKFYVDLDGYTSQLYDSDDGTIQGSVLGPILYAIYVSPLFDLTSITNFADDNFVIEFNPQVNALIINMQMKLEMIVKWLKDSGLKVNESKTELCLFHRNDTQKVTITIQNEQIISKKSMNILGVIFDTKLTWSDQVASTIKKSNKALCALRLIKPYLTPPVMRTLIISNYYSVLYYNSEIWLSPNLNADSKQQLLSASANALCSCMPLPNPFISFEAIHKFFNHSTPEQIGNYKLSLLLHKTYNSTTQNKDWLELADQIVITGRQSKFISYKSNNYKIGLNILVNRFYSLKQRIVLDDLNHNMPVFKKKMKTEFKPNEL